VPDCEEFRFPSHPNWKTVKGKRVENHRSLEHAVKQLQSEQGTGVMNVNVAININKDRVELSIQVSAMQLSASLRRGQPRCVVIRVIIYSVVNVLTLTLRSFSSLSILYTSLDGFV
jgi:hypothetical protein